MIRVVESKMESDEKTADYFEERRLLFIKWCEENSHRLSRYEPTLIIIPEHFYVPTKPNLGTNSERLYAKLLTMVPEKDENAVDWLFRKRVFHNLDYFWFPPTVNLERWVEANKFWFGLR